MIATFGSRLVEYRQDTIRKDVKLRVPAMGRWARFRHDFETAAWDFMPRQLVEGNVKYAVPEIVRTRMLYNGRVYDYVPVPKDWQYFLYDLWAYSVDNIPPVGKLIRTYTKPNNSGLFSEYTDGSLLWYYGNMIEKSRAWTDSWSPEVGARDYVTGRNLSARDWEWLCRPTGGNLFEIVKEDGKYFYARALDMTHPPPRVEDVFDDPGVIHWATEITTNELPRLPNRIRHWVVSDFPQAEHVCDVNRITRVGTPYAFLSLGGLIQVEKVLAELLPNGAEYSPYNPKK